MGFLGASDDGCLHNNGMVSIFTDQSTVPNNNHFGNTVISSNAPRKQSSNDKFL